MVRPSHIAIWIFLLPIHIVTNFIFVSLNVEYNFYWRLFDFIWIVSVCSLILITLKQITNVEFLSASKFGAEFLNNTRTLSFTIIVFLGINLLFQISKIFLTSKFLKIIQNELNLLFFVAFSFLFISYQYAWLFQIKRKNNKPFLRGLYLCAALYTFLLFFILFSTEPVGIFENDARYLLTLAFGIIYLFAFKVKIWLPLSSRQLQKKILWYSLLMIGILIPILGFDNNLIGIQYSNAFFLDFTKFFAFPLFITYIRTFYISIMSLPFSKVIEQKVYEVNTLAYLSRIVRNFNNLEVIYNTIVELSYNSMKLSPSALFLYDKSNHFQIKSVFGSESEKDQIKLFFAQKEIQKIVQSIKQPIVIPSISDKFGRNHNLVAPIFESLCVVPLISNDDKIGDLVVLNKEPYLFDEDDLNLLASYVETLSISIEGNNLLQQTIEKEKYKQELLIAKEIQINFLPKEVPKFKDISIETFFKPSEEVGGDFYDFIQLDNNRLLVLIGDVSGKGMSAAFYMALLKGIILSHPKDGLSIFSFLSNLNKTLFNQIDKRIHITMSCLLIDTQSKSFEYFRAGHLPMICISNGQISLENPKGVGISLVNSKFFENNLVGVKRDIRNSTYFLLLTDGLVEALGQKDINAGFERLKQILNSSVYNNTLELKQLLLEEVNRNGTIFDDDITLLIIKYEGE